jgi:hypothetical protein
MNDSLQAIDITSSNYSFQLINGNILAILDIGVIAKNTDVITAQCRINNKNDGAIVALVKPSNGPYFKNIIKAWRAMHRQINL